jgi:hypothetical protein
MALTRKQKQEVIDTLNKKYKKEAKDERQVSFIDFNIDKENSKFKGKIKSFLSKLPSLPPAPSEESQQSLLPAAAPLEIYSSLESLLGPEKMGAFVGGFVQRQVENKIPKDDQNVFFTIESPKEKEITVPLYGWELSWLENAPTNYTKDFLKTISASDRKDIISKLDFAAEWKQYGDKSGYALHTKISTAKAYLVYTFQLPEFLEAAKKRLARENFELGMDREDLVEKLAEVLDAYAEKEHEYYSSDDYLLESADEYPAEDARNEDFEIVKKELDEEIIDYIDQLESIGMEEDDIVEMLIDSGEYEVASYYTVDNEIGSYIASSDHQIDDLDWSMQGFEPFKNSGLPYTDKINDNVHLLTEEEAKELKHAVSECHLYVQWSNEADGYEIRYMTVYTSDNDRVVLVVDPQTFISKAKRKIKDRKLEVNQKKIGKKKAASLEGEKMKKYSALSKVLASKVQADADIMKKTENLPPVAKREMIATLYEAIARNVLPMDENRIQWMVHYIHNNMSDNEINSEWEFIRKGHVQKLVKLFKQLEAPGMMEKHADKMLDLQRLHQEISEGIMRTKEAGSEVDPKTFDAIEKIVIDFADDFADEIAGKKKLPGGKKQTLLKGYSALSKVLDKKGN